MTVLIGIVRRQCNREEACFEFPSSVSVDSISKQAPLRTVDP